MSLSLDYNMLQNDLFVPKATQHTSVIAWNEIDSRWLEEFGELWLSSEN